MYALTPEHLLAQLGVDAECPVRALWCVKYIILTVVKMIYLAPRRVPPMRHRASIRLEHGNAPDPARSRHLLCRPGPRSRLRGEGSLAERRCLPPDGMRIGLGSGPGEAPQVPLQ